MVPSVTANNLIHAEHQLRPRRFQPQKPPAAPQSETTHTNRLLEWFSSMTLLGDRQAKQQQAIDDQITTHCHFTAMLRQETERLRQEAEAIAEEAERMRKILLIASRIMAGDNVPPEDKEFLMEHAPQLYRIAILSRVENDNPTDYDSILEEETE